MLFIPAYCYKYMLFAFTRKERDFHYTFIPREESLSIARASSRNKSNILKGNSGSSLKGKIIYLWRH